MAAINFICQVLTDYSFFPSAQKYAINRAKVTSWHELPSFPHSGAEDLHGLFYFFIHSLQTVVYKAIQQN